ncbi:iron chaperone [Aquihabitans daechungensis]|uniref:iron chaperone n=1 Tax=Aquihabitans daechungensis TaxID=1052257 RepID=UPI003BA07AFC
MADKPATVEQYLAGFEPDVADRLRLVRTTLHDAVPGMTDGIRYGMPIVALDGTYVVHYAGWKHHIGLYPVPVFDGDRAALEEDLAPLRSSKDTIKLMHRDPIPTGLLERLVRALVVEHAKSD